jgi:hypothetical protein
LFRLRGIRSHKIRRSNSNNTASGGQPEAATPSEADIRSSDENPGEKDTAPKKEELDNEILLNRLNNLLGPI